MASFRETLEERQQQWNRVKQAFSDMENKYNDLKAIVDGSNQFIKDEFKKFDERNKITASYNEFKETFDNYTLNTVSFDDTSDWDAVQEFYDEFEKAKTALKSAFSAFEG